MRLGFGLDMAPPRVSAAAAASTIADLYGTGLGQMPLDHDPLAAVLDGNGNVTSLPNKGGAGAAFNATAPLPGLRVGDGLFSIPAFFTGSDGGLHLQNAADCVGIRMFFTGLVDPALGHDPRIAGSPAVGHNTHIRISRSSGNLVLSRGAASLAVGGGGMPPGGVMRLYEVEIVGGFARAFLNGQSFGAPVACNWPDFRVDRLFVGQSHGFQGQAGRIQLVITDGSAALDPVMLRVRQALAAQYGIAPA